MDLKNMTPSKSGLDLKNKHLKNPGICHSPFRSMPSISTPPSRFTKIINPFEPHLTERLHLPIFSPNVFNQNSTTNKSTDNEKFWWTIDDISSMRPANIDEETISQHIADNDPQVESLVQQKIDCFFRSNTVVESPMTVKMQRVNLILSTSPPLKTGKVKLTYDASAQTVLTLPSILPPHLEEALRPYFTYTEDQHTDPNSSFYQTLFGSGSGVVEEDNNDDRLSSPALSTGLSPIQFSPANNATTSTTRPRNFDTSFEITELSDCALSPIVAFGSHSRSVCRLDFTRPMSVDLVPDISQLPPQRNQTVTTCLEGTDNSMAMMSSDDVTNNWEEEFKQVTTLSPSSDGAGNNTSDTPHSRVFTSQRQKKKLSDSFNTERDVEITHDTSSCIVSKKEVVPRSLMKSKMFLDDDTGYCTNNGESSNCDNNMFSSTPTKNKTGNKKLYK